MDQLVKRLRRGRGRDGFTLIEVLVAMGILATGLLAVSAAQLYAMHGGRSGRHTTDAAEIAQSQVEVFQRMDWTDAGLNATGGWGPAGGQTVNKTVNTTSVPTTEQAYVLTWRIVDVSSYLKTIEVRVTWDEPNRPGRSYIVPTMRHNDARS
jgi:prepilin-type N-terminal cleavage/methylation domain-containing protein